MKKLMSALTVIAALAGLTAGAVEIENTTETTTTTTTTTVVTEKTVKEKTKWKPLKVCVLDFTTSDQKGFERFLTKPRKEIVVKEQNSLKEEDRKSVNSVMQGFVKMIDAWTNKKTHDANVEAQVDDNEFDQEAAIAMYDKTVNGAARPVVLGAEYLTAYLGRYNDVFSCADTELVALAMEKVKRDPDFPKDFMLKVARETGVTHLIYGSVSDIRTKENSFKGYGIETKTTICQLDVLIKVVELATQATVFSNVYTGTYREQRPISVEQFDNNIFQNLMTSALEQAAEELHDICKPGRKNQLSGAGLE